jgi:hypothetical protein
MRAEALVKGRMEGDLAVNIYCAIVTEMSRKPAIDLLSTNHGLQPDVVDPL